MTVLAYRVAYLTPGAFTETREDYLDDATANTRADELEQDGKDVAVYRIDLEASA